MAQSVLKTLSVLNPQRDLQVPRKLYRALALANTGQINSFNRFFNRDPAEELIYFLFVSGRSNVAKDILNAVINLHSYCHFSKKTPTEIRKILTEGFLNALLHESKKIYDFPTEQVLANPELFVEDIRLARQFKKLVSEVFNTLGYESPKYSLFNNLDGKDFNQEALDIENSAQMVKNLVYCAQQSQGMPVVTSYKYLNDNLTGIPKQVDKKKSKVRNKKRIFTNLLLVVSSIIGVGEAFAPAKFYLMMLIGLGMTAPVSYTLTALTFVAAFAVNTIFFYDRSYDGLKNTLLQNRLFKDARGNKLKVYEIALNLLAITLSLFSALVMAAVSFSFSGFGLLFASIVSLMTFIGFLGVLLSTVTTLWNLQSIKKLANYLKELVLYPIITIFSFKSTLKGKIKNITVFLINIIALVVMFGLSLSVVAVTAGMIFTTLMSIPQLAVFGSFLIALMVGIAELALGALFIHNVCKVVEFVRSLLVNRNNHRSVVSDPSNLVRKEKVAQARLSKILLVSFVLLNASGYAIGYFNIALSHSLLIATLSLGGLVTPLVGILIIAAPILAALSYGFASIGSTLPTSLTAISAPPLFMPYKDHDDFFGAHNDHQSPSKSPVRARPVDTPQPPKPADTRTLEEKIQSMSVRQQQR